MGARPVDALAGDWATDRGRLVTSQPAPRVVLLAVTGYLDVALARRIVATVDKALVEPSRPHIFNDWEKMTGYDSAARVLLTEWALRIRPQLESVHILVTSRLVAMGVSVANLAVGGILNPYTDRGAFERMLEQRLRQPAQAAAQPH